MAVPFYACAAEWLRAVCRSHTAEIRLIAAQRKPQIPARYALFAEQIKRQPALPAKTGISPPPTAEYKQN